MELRADGSQRNAVVRDADYDAEQECDFIEIVAAAVGYAVYDQPVAGRQPDLLVFEHCSPVMSRNQRSRASPSPFRSPNRAACGARLSANVPG